MQAVLTRSAAWTSLPERGVIIILEANRGCLPRCTGEGVGHLLNGEAAAGSACWLAVDWYGNGGLGGGTGLGQSGGHCHCAGHRELH